MWVKKRSEFYCDTCDRDFVSQDLFQIHVAEHVTCKLDGCKFTAHPKILLKHIEMQHSGNLFSRVKGYDTPAEVEKWKLERKSNYPTVENVEKKKQTTIEKFKRGERIPSQTFRRGKRTPQTFTREKRTPSQNFTREKSIPSQNFTREKIIPSQNFTREKRIPAQTFPIGLKHETGNGNGTVTENLVILEKFYAQVRVGKNGALVGRKFMEWDFNCHGASGVPKLTSDDRSDVEDFQDELMESTCITDEDEMVEDTPPKVNNSILENSDSFKASFVKNQENTTEHRPVQPPKDKPSSLIGLVAYSSDSESDGGPPDEIPIISLKEDGEISEEEVADDDPKMNCLLPVTASVSPHNNSLETVNISSLPYPSNPLRTKGAIHNHNEKRDFPKKDFVKRIQSHTMKKRKPNMSRLLRMLLDDDIRRERNEILQVCRFICEKNFFDV